MKKILLLAQLITLSAPFSAPALHGQVASLVKDINVADVPRSQPGPVLRLHSLGESALFQMREDTVWVSDGSEGGTRMLTELCPGECSSSMQVIGTARNLLFWVATTSNVSQLWRSDGTRPGTFPLTGPDGGLGAYYPPQVIAGDLVFSSDARTTSAVSSGEQTARWPAPGSSPTWCAARTALVPSRCWQPATGFSSLPTRGSGP